MDKIAVSNNTLQTFHSKISLNLFIHMVCYLFIHMVCYTIKTIKILAFHNQSSYCWLI